MKKTAIGVGLGALLLVPILVVVFFAGAMYNAPTDNGDAGSYGQAGLKTGTVPPEFEPWVIKAGKMCPEIGAPVIAAQIEVESGWNPAAVSPAGAQGLSQFMPGTWPTYAVDANGNGTASPFDPPDAIMAQAKFDCTTAAQAKRDLASGRIHGDLLDIVLSAYNCGYGCVLANGGPNINNGETEGYAPKIKSLIPKYSSIGVGTGRGAGRLAGPVNRRIIQAAMRWLGTPYAWAGGTKDGPSAGSYPDVGVTGFDCSGLTLYAVYQATGGKIELPHYTGDHSLPGQLYDPRGKEVQVAQMQPGDLIYFGSGGNTHHVGIYYGVQNGQQMLLNAPQSGDVVSIMPLSGWNGEDWYVRRFG
ncbi:NlpC/P60 family protein (plasmid) [Gordonia polyisoprenivorans]|uniref:C40 family peptidase n=1 Tax=Gordonia polyisoprenivorans TaxID=84595 RepID=UPI002234BF21|nr:bifunctional lytic transglycosylase/C40 family peptidase [uncultured Gordonia sp.]UZF59358.1 NlpC/P60 family protein [Gordonia polyisoprenivorans]